jgi:hypothetical protein
MLFQENSLAVREEHTVIGKVSDRKYVLEKYGSR